MLNLKPIGNAFIDSNKSIGTTYRQGAVSNGSHQFLKFKINRNKIIDNIFRCFINIKPFYKQDSA